MAAEKRYEVNGLRNIVQMSARPYIPIAGAPVDGKALAEESRRRVEAIEDFRAWLQAEIASVDMWVAGLSSHPAKGELEAEARGLRRTLERLDVLEGTIRGCALELGRDR